MMKNSINLLFVASLLMLPSCEKPEEAGRITPDRGGVASNDTSYDRVKQKDEKSKNWESRAEQKAKPPVIKTKTKAPEKDEVTKLVEKQFPYLKIKPLDEITNSWKDVPYRAFPSAIKSSQKVPMDQIADGKKVGTLTFPAGRDLKPIKQVGDKLQVSSPSNNNLVGLVPMDSTNFKQLIQKRYDDFVAKANEKTDLQRAQAKRIVLAKQKEQRSTSSSASTKPVSIATITGRGSSISASDPRLAAVKKSIEKGGIPAKLSSVKAYYWNGSQTLSGAFSGSYETVNVVASATTIFGTFETEYKCVLRGSKVVGWVDPVTGKKVR